METFDHYLDDVGVCLVLKAPLSKVVHRPLPFDPGAQCWTLVHVSMVLVINVAPWALAVCLPFPSSSEKESTCISPFVHPKVHVITCSSSTPLLIHASTEEFTWFSYVRTRLVPRSYVRFPRPQKASPNAHLFHPH